MNSSVDTEAAGPANGKRRRILLLISAGFVVIGVLWGIGSEEELRAAGAVALAREPCELVALLGA